MSAQIIFGTATFGMDGTQFQDQDSVTSVLQHLKDAGVKRLDSGARYPPRNPGRSEQLIGLSNAVSSSFLIDTKIYTDVTKDGSGDLTADAIGTSVDTSLSRLQMQSQGINVLHIHRADPTTPVRDQVRAFNEQIILGHCKAWGVSNVPILMLEEMLRVCDEEQLQKPVCYQGEYNMVTRGAERELLPLLRKHGMSFNAFRPLAAGFLTGNLLTGNADGTRFGKDNPLGKTFEGLFSAEDLHSAMARFLKATAELGLSPVEVAIRWILYDSALGEKDGVILGASKVEQVKQVLSYAKNGPLPDHVMDLAGSLWEAVKESRANIM